MLLEKSNKWWGIWKIFNDTGEAKVKVIDWKHKRNLEKEETVINAMPHADSSPGKPVLALCHPQSNKTQLNPNHPHSTKSMSCTDASPM